MTAGLIEMPGAVSPPAIALLHSFATGVIASRERSQVIDREDDPYIDRWYLARKAMVPGVSPRGHFLDQVAPIPSELENLYLHRYSRADREEPHCHPWPNGTLVVAGWYVEQIYVDGQLIDTRIRRPGDIVLRDAEAVHAIVDVEPGTLSLFATMPKMRDWGFHTATGFVPWHEFHAFKAAQAEAA